MKNLSILLTILFVCSFNLLDAQKAGNFLTFGIGSGFIPSDQTLTSYDNDYSSRIKISQGIDVYSSYEHHYSTRSMIEAGLLLSFDKLEASVYEIDNPENYRLMNNTVGKNQLGRGLIYLGYGYKIRLTDKDFIKVGLNAGIPFLFNNPGKLITYEARVSDGHEIDSDGTINRVNEGFNVIVSPNLSYSRIIGSKGNKLTVYFGYSQALAKMFNGHLEGNGYASQELYYNALDFGLSYSFKLKK